MLSVAEIITAMPKAGGDYFFITRTMGPAAGAVAGLLSWFSLSLKGSFALLGMSAFLAPVTGADPMVVSLSITVIFVVLNLAGVHHASLFQSILVIGLLALMSLYVFLGAGGNYFEPFTPNGWPAVFSTADLAFISTANAGIMAASRYLLALSRDGLMPAVFGRVSNRSGAPYNAVIITGIFVAGSLFLRPEILIKAASTVLILTYLLSNICVIVLRESMLLNYRPGFRSPLYPWVQVLGSLGFILLILEMGMEALSISLILILSGLTF